MMTKKEFNKLDKEKKEFWLKFTEFANKKKKEEEQKKQIAEDRIKALQYEWLHDNYDFEEIEEVSWLSFDYKKIQDMEDDEKDQRFAKIKHILKEHNVSVDVDMDAIFGGMNYDPLLLKKICQTLPVNGISLMIRMNKKAGVSPLTRSDNSA